MASCSGCLFWGQGLRAGNWRFFMIHLSQFTLPPQTHKTHSIKRDQNKMNPQIKQVIADKNSKKK